MFEQLITEGAGRTISNSPDAPGSCPARIAEHALTAMLTGDDRDVCPTVCPGRTEIARHLGPIPLPPKHLCGLAPQE